MHDEIEEIEEIENEFHIVIPKAIIRPYHLLHTDDMGEEVFLKDLFDQIAKDAIKAKQA